MENMKTLKKIVAGVFTAFVASLFFSCSNEIIGYSVVLWNIPEALIADGEVVPVYMKSNISKTYLVGTPDETQRVEVPLWKITEPESKSKAIKLASSHAQFDKQYAVSVLDGLPIRKEPKSVAKQVYRLRQGEIIRTCYIGKGETPTNGRTPLEGDWYWVITSSGVSGWCFSYNLRTFEIAADGTYDYEGEGIVKVQSSDQLLESSLEKYWYPDYYSKMISKKEIDLKYMKEDFGFDPGAESGTIKVKTDSVDLVYPYDGVTSTADHVYKMNGTPITLTLRSEKSLLLRYTDETGKPYSINFVTLEDDVSALIQGEQARRNRAYNTLVKNGPGYSSSNYGALSFTGGNTFRWTGYENLQPSIIASGSGVSGTVTSKYFVPKTLNIEFDGLLTFVFKNSSREVNFFYKNEANGIRLCTARVVVTKDITTGREVAEVSKPDNAQVLFFNH